MPSRLSRSRRNCADPSEDGSWSTGWSLPPLRRAAGAGALCADEASGGRGSGDRDGALAAQATGCPAYVVHVSTEEGLAALERARRRGVPLWAETCPQYILLNDEALSRYGAAARIAPPLRQPRDQRALATALRTGAVNTLGSDHASYSREAKAQGGEDIFAAPFGMPGAPTHFPSMFTFAQDNGFDLSTVVRAMSDAPARLFGLQRRKGSLAPGTDADLIFVDPRPGGWSTPDRSGLPLRRTPSRASVWVAGPRRLSSAARWHSTAGRVAPRVGKPFRKRKARGEVSWRSGLPEGELAGER